jgi:hypothetical protein
MQAGAVERVALGTKEDIVIVVLAFCTMLPGVQGVALRTAYLAPKREVNEEDTSPPRKHTTSCGIVFHKPPLQPTP